MKLPKKVIIAGKEWIVKTNKNVSGGKFSTGSFSIEVGTKYPKDILDIFFHEVVEALLTERNLRYTIQRSQPENGDYLFNFNHEQFSQIIPDLIIALKDVIMK